MSGSLVRLTRSSPRIARVTYDNPPVNLVVGQAVRELAELVETLLADTELHVVVFDSAVPDYFYNHFDLAHLDEFPATDPHTGTNPWTELVVALTNAPFITIGLIRGRARGGGNELALALDLRYASIENARFGQPEVATAVVPGGGGTERLPRLVGRDRALEAILTSADHDAATAERWGWITRALPDADLDAHVDQLAELLAAYDLPTLTQAKAMVNRATLPPEHDLIDAYAEFLATSKSPAFRARMAAPSPPAEAMARIEHDLGAVLAQAALTRLRSNEAQ